ncbi:MAG TPA: class I SAM-dependent methyltransferase [Candidatus Sulfotelmatobacter sp.]|nr:class I SAM-dependent methyltransferase [Candidatus Sulfotelmatobacter sp.]
MHNDQLGPLPTELAERIRKEAAENDEIYQRRSPDNLDLSKIHYFHEEMLDWAIEQFGGLRGKRILDVGIGDGFSSALMARAGAQVSGIDVSPAALARAQTLAERYSIDLDLQEMPGEDLRYEDEAFDGILCISAYHHMDQNRAAREFARVLKAGGRLVMIDPLATNPPAWLYRRTGRLFRRESTSDETPLRVRDLRTLQKHFDTVEWRGKYFLSVGLIGLERIWKNPAPSIFRFTESTFRWLSPLDSAFLKLPGLQRLAWKIAVVAQKSEKA